MYTVSGTAAGTPYTLTFTRSLSGTGVPPLTVSVSNHDFGSVLLGNLSSTRTVTITNTSSSLFAVTGFTPPATTGNFQVSSNTCNNTTFSLAPSGQANSSCSFTVHFKSNAAGPFNTTFNYSTTASNSGARRSAAPGHH